MDADGYDGRHVLIQRVLLNVRCHCQKIETEAGLGKLFKVLAKQDE